MLKFIAKIFGTKADRDLKLLYPIVDQVNTQYSLLQSISDDELRHKTIVLKAEITSRLSEKVESDSSLNIHQKDAIFNEIDQLEGTRNTELEKILLDILPTAFAVVKETAHRLTVNKQLRVKATVLDHELATKYKHITFDGEYAVWSNTWEAAGSEMVWGMIHYDVQLIGGAVLHQGRIAEMATGEGKTLVATLPAYLNALPGKGVHIVTVNDYLAKRDSEWMAPLFEFHGLRVDCIDKHQPHSPGRVKAYSADITYGTNNEFGFDYLRDNMSNEPGELVQRKHHYAMVDEVDSVLIDDARTPLIISGPVPQGDKHEFHEMKPRVEKLVAAQRKYINIILADSKKLLAGMNDQDTKRDKKKEEEWD